MIRLHELVFDILEPELTTSSNVHYHGIWVTDISTWRAANDYIHDVFRDDPIIGFVCIKEMKEEDGWTAYIAKQMDYIADTLYAKTFLRPLTDIRRREREREEILAQERFFACVDAVETSQQEILEAHAELVQEADNLSYGYQCMKAHYEQHPLEAPNRAGEGKVNTQPGEAGAVPPPTMDGGG